MIDVDKFQFAPVLVPTLYRADHFIRLVESLKRCKYADRTELIIGLDFPFKEQHEIGYKKIQNFIENGITGFKNVYVIKHSSNVGQRNNMYSMMNYASSKYDRYIVAEDDNVFGYSFLTYMNAMLEKIKYNNEIVMISGFSYPVEWVDLQGYGVIAEKSFFSAWGYATYFKTYNAIKEYYSSCNYLLQFQKSQNAKKIFRTSKKNFCYYIHGIWGKNISPNDIGISLYQLCNEKYCLMPTASLVRNEGWDGSGQNCTDNNMLKTLFENQKISDSDIDWFSILDKENIIYNPENEKIINDFFPPQKDLYIKAIIKWILLRFGLKK